MKRIIPILHNVRSLHNVGAILRTSEGLGLNEVWVSGYTPYPEQKNDQRLPHVSRRATSQIAKTALGAEKLVKIRQFADEKSLESAAREEKISLVAVEQAPNNVSLDDFQPVSDIGVIFGNETDGTDEELLKLCDQVLEIEMKGKKESFNVSATAAMVLYTITSQSD